ncbi:copper uptake system-associated protein [Rhodobacter sp. KR11]|uniref:copper uptake system-associated protein n=1 Tax=Rhodobacter sp. KR11 TaxID=2974588 RepID=UPI00222320AA|nr:copper uptake system-associated protein [Rhodobacter sp. KR11]MCW1918464.1 copper uptake system-associated protein [Rhodobacter sp. KR11]
MKLTLTLCGALFALPALAHEGVHVTDPFARFVGPSGAAYFQVTNHAQADDRLISASSPDVGMVMIMTNSADENGVMKMTDLPDGIVLPGEASHDLAPGGDHVMLMQPKHPVKDGETISVTLVFEHAGAVTVTIPVMNKREEAPGDGPTDFDAASGEEAAAVAPATDAPATDAPAMGAISTEDQGAIITLMKAQFDKPEAPLTVDPVVVMGDHALASWAQGDTAGRALLERRAEGWAIILCAGPELRAADFLAQHGVAGAEHLSAMFNAAEDGLGSDAVARFSTFDQVVMITDPASHGDHAAHGTAADPHAAHKHAAP